MARGRGPTGPATGARLDGGHGTIGAAPPGGGGAPRRGSGAPRRGGGAPAATRAPGLGVGACSATNRV
jgi:hypothetical protein